MDVDGIHIYMFSGYLGYRNTWHALPYSKSQSESEGYLALPHPTPRVNQKVRVTLGLETLVGFKVRFSLDVSF